MSKYTRLKNSLPFFILLLIPLVLIIPSIGSINYPPGGEYSDLAITHLPNAEFIKHSILVDHQIPLWNPLIMSGYPFAGDPLSGLWYPPGWLALLFPLPLGINLVTALHIAAGAIGLFLLLKKLSIRKGVALIFGISFALLPKIYAHYGAGHITYIFAVCLTPVLMWAEASREDGKSRLSKMNIVLSALIFLADMRWYPFALIAWGCTSAITHTNYSTVSVETGNKNLIIFRKIWKIISQISAEAFISLLIAAPLLIPFIEFLLRSTRIHISGGENLIYSLPPDRLLGLLIPPEGGFAEWAIYPGLGIIFLVLVSLITRNRKIILTTVIFIISLFWALGKNIPFIGFLESLPGLNLVRVPPRIVFLGDIMAIIAGALTVEWILNQTTDMVKKRITLILTGTGLFILLLGVGIGILQGQLNHSIIRLLILTPLYACCLIFLTRKKHVLLPIIMLCIVVIADLYLTDVTMFTPSSKQNVPDTKAIEIIKNDKSQFRVYSPTYSIRQEVAERYGIQLVQGVNPMQLVDYVDYLEKASNIPYEEYSVVIPHLAEPGSESAIKSRIFDGKNNQLLDELNVRYMIFDAPLIFAKGWQLLSYSDGQWIYERQSMFPREVLFSKSGGPRGEGVTVDKYTPNEIIISISRHDDLELHLSEIYYPGWRVWVDGIEKSITNWGIFRMVKLPMDAHQVIFKYQPFTLFIGLLISGIILLAGFIPTKKVKYD